MARGESHITTDHKKIRSWAEKRGGHPASVKGTHGKKHDVGLLRIRFTDDEDLEDVTWDEFFEKFEEKHLALLYQDETKEGKESRFFKLIDRSGADEKRH